MLPFSIPATATTKQWKYTVRVILIGHVFWHPNFKQTRQNGLQNNWLLMLSLHSWFSRILLNSLKNTQNTPSKCVITKKLSQVPIIIQNVSLKSPRKCYHEVFKALFSTKKTATKCVIIRNFSKSQKMLSWSIQGIFCLHGTYSKIICVI